MYMTSEEIVRDYRQARDKSKQIKILADRNVVTQSEIRAILAEAGVEGVKAPQRIRRKKPVPPAEGPESPADGTVESPAPLGPVELSIAYNGCTISVAAPSLADARQISEYLQLIISDLGEALT